MTYGVSAWMSSLRFQTHIVLRSKSAKGGFQNDSLTASFRAGILQDRTRV